MPTIIKLKKMLITQELRIVMKNLHLDEQKVIKAFVKHKAITKQKVINKAINRSGI